MEIIFVRSFQSEWLKRKRSAASWLVIIGAFFIPLILCIGNTITAHDLYAVYTSEKFWETLFNQCWQFMALFLLPIGVILSTSLITQIEYRNNTWKQLHTLPQKFTTIFFAKLSVIVMMMVQFFVLFNIGIYLCGIIPSFLVSNIPYPQETFPFMYFIKENLYYFIDCLPIIAMQYLLSMRFKNFMVPLGVGLALFVGSMIAMSWEYNYAVPYIYCTLHFLQEGGDTFSSKYNIHLLAGVYFIAFTAISYFLYIFKKEKG